MNTTLCWTLLVLAGLGAYLPALRSFFVKDDLTLILSAQTTTANLLTHSWPGGFFRPAAELLFAIQYALFGLDPLPYHVISLSTHAVATILLYQILRRLLSNRDQSIIGALIFALHPLQAESVSWISGQMSLFAGLCTLLLIYLLVCGRSIRPTTPALVIAIGLGFYESFAVAPILGFAIYGYSPHISRQTRPLHITLTVFLTALFIGIYFYWRFAVLGLRGGNYAVSPSIETALTNLLYYLYMLLGGSAIGGRILYYQPNQIFSATHLLQVFPPFFIATTTLLISALSLYLYRHLRTENTSVSKETFLPILWLLAALLPALILPERPRRLAYTSVPAFAILIGAIFSYLQQKTRHGVLLTRAGLLLYLAVMATSLHDINRDWQIAGAIEKGIPALLGPKQMCANLVIDAPNLLGNALFFNSLSTERWVEHVTGKNIPVYDAHQSPVHSSLQSPICAFRYIGGNFVSIEPGANPYFIRGQNWAFPPRPPLSVIPSF